MVNYKTLLIKKTTFKDNPLKMEQSLILTLYHVSNETQ